LNSDDIYYTVSYSGRATESLEAAGRRAKAIGRAREVRDAGQLLEKWLRADPETLGEPFRVHRSKELTEYIGFVGPLVVRFNIHHATKTVYVLRPVEVARRAGF
jgi:hypothetical protein